MLLLILTGLVTNTMAQTPMVKDIDRPIDISKISKLGYYDIDHIPGTRLLGGTTQAPLNVAAVIPNVAGKFYNFLYDGKVLIQTGADADLATLNRNPVQNNELYYTVRAFEILKQYYPDAYQKLVINSGIADASRITGNNFSNWINSFSKIVISFNNVSNSIAISGTVLADSGTAVTVNAKRYNVYNNLPVISINPDLIAGVNQQQGSRPIYQKPTAAENYSLYLKEGLLHTIVHELIHRVIDVYNNDMSSAYNYINQGSGRLNVTDPLYDYEEVLVSRTINDYFRRKGGFSEQLLSYYDVADLHRVLKIGQVNINKYTTDLAAKSGVQTYELKFLLLD